jgi:hypothetical protein
MANTRRTLDWFPRPLSATTPDLNGAPPPGTLIAFAMVARSRLVRIHMRSHDSTTTDFRYSAYPRLDPPRAGSRSQPVRLQRPHPI